MATWPGGYFKFALLLLLSCPSHNVLPLAGACLCPLCEGGSRIADLESGRVRDVHASTVKFALVCLGV